MKNKVLFFTFIFIFYFTTSSLGQSYTVYDLQSTSPITCAKAAIYFQTKPSDEAIPYLINLLSNRTSLEWVLIAPGFDKAIPGQEPKVLSSTSPGEEAVKALVAIGKPAVGQLLSDLVFNSWAYSVLEEIIRSDESTRDLVAAYLVHPRYSVRSDIRWMLKQANWNPKTKSDSIKYFYACGMWDQFEALYEPGTDKSKIRKLIVETLVKDLNDNDYTIRKDIICQLGDLKDSSARVYIIKALQDEQWEVRKEAFRALGKMNDKLALGILFDYLKDEDESTKILAVSALGQLKDPRLIRPMLIEAKNGSWHFAKEVIYELSNYGTSIIDSMINILYNEKDYQTIAINVLEAIGRPAVKSLLQALICTNSSVQIYAVNALAQITDTSAVLPLIQLTKGNIARDVKISVYEGLCCFSHIDRRVIVPLTEALDEEFKSELDRYYFLSAIIRGLGNSKDTSAVLPLSRILCDDRNINLWSNTIYYLVKIGDPVCLYSVVEILGPKYKKPKYEYVNVYLKKDAINALKELTKQDFGEDYMQWKSWITENIERKPGQD